MMQPYAIEIEPALPSRSQARIAWIGEAPGEKEVEQGKPFVGPSGRLLDKWMTSAKIKRRHCLISNVFRQRPDNNQIRKFFIKPELAEEQEIEVWTRIGNYAGLGYPMREYRPHFYQLRKLLQQYCPAIIFTLGRTAAWALTGNTAIGSMLGQATASHKFWKLESQVIPLYHPAYLLRSHDQDLDKRITKSIKTHKEGL